MVTCVAWKYHWCLRWGAPLPPPHVNSMLIQTYKKKMTLLHDGKKKFQHKIPKVWEETLTNDDLQGTQVTNYYYFAKAKQ